MSAGNEQIVENNAFEIIGAQSKITMARVQAVNVGTFGVDKGSENAKASEIDLFITVLKQLQEDNIES
jgi:hypothetical protein